MVARLKLKGIDGRAPPGVDIVSSGFAPKSSHPELGAGVKWLLVWVYDKGRVHSGDIIELRGNPKALDNQAIAAM